jgi:hypothetical protein
VPACRAAEHGGVEQPGSSSAAAPAGSARSRTRNRKRAVNDLTALLVATRRIAVQTRQGLSGAIPDGATRQVSLHDPDARPLGQPVDEGKHCLRSSARDRHGAVRRSLPQRDAETLRQGNRRRRGRSVVRWARAAI